MRFNKVILTILALMTIFFTGCWDSIEINERTFITATGADLNKNPKEEGRYTVTYVYPNIGALGKNPTQKEIKSVKVTNVETPFDGSRQMTTRTNNPFFFKHLKVVVIGEDLFKKPEMIKEFFDGLDRDTRINSNIKIVVAQGTAKDVLSTKTEEPAVIGGYLYSMLQNTSLAARFTEKTFLELKRDFDFSNASLIPRAVPKKDEFKLSGGAVIKGYKMLGWIGEKENRAIAIVKGKVKSEIINILYDDIHISYVATKVKPKKKISVENGKIKVYLNIFMEGYVQEYKLNSKQDVFSKGFTKKAESEISNVVKKEIENVSDILQKKYNADIFGIAEHISKFNPDLWEEVKDNWDEIFPNIDIIVNVKAKIRRTGLTR